MRRIVLSFCLITLVCLSSCTTFLPFGQPDHPKPFEGLVKEPIFNQDVYIRMTGNPRKPVVVFVHGLGDAATVWDRSIEHLSNDYFLVALDLPGFGRSSKTNQLYSPENYAKLIRYLTQTYVKKPFHLVGHSMGGAISLRYAATYSEDVNTLTLVSAAGMLHRLAYSKYLAALGLQPLSHFLNIEKNDITSVTGFIFNTLGQHIPIDLDQMIESEMLRGTLLLGRPSIISAMALVLDDFSELITHVTAPTRLIWGELDAVTPLRIGQVLDNLIENADLHIMHGVGHVPMKENPEKFNQLLVQSLDSTFPETVSRRQTGTTKISVRCEKRNRVTYTGIINTLVINKCNDIYIENARINQLTIRHSRVYLNNVDIKSKYTALDVQSSTVEITAGKIEGNTAIKTQNSRLDIAGTKLIAKEQVINAASPADSLVVFSLTPILNARGQSSIAHGLYSLKARQNVFDY